MDNQQQQQPQQQQQYGNQQDIVKLIADLGQIVRQNQQQPPSQPQPKSNSHSFLTISLIIILFALYVFNNFLSSNGKIVTEGDITQRIMNEMDQIHTLSQYVEVFRIPPTEIQQPSKVIVDHAHKYLSHKNAHVVMIQEIDPASNQSIIMYMNHDRPALLIGQRVNISLFTRIWNRVLGLLWEGITKSQPPQPPQAITMQYAYNLCVIGYSDSVGTVMSIGNLMAPFETQSITTVHTTIKIAYDMKFDGDVYRVNEWVSGDIAAQMQIKLKKYGSLCYFK